MQLQSQNPQFLARRTLYGALYPRLPPNDDYRPARNVYAFYARTERFKYVIYLRRLPRTDRTQKYYTIHSELAEFLTRERGDEDLYDLPSDPYEQTDLADNAEYDELITTFRSGIIDWWASTGGRKIQFPE